MNKYKKSACLNGFRIAALFGMILLGTSGCSPFYTWGYAPTIHPDATTAYIHAVMAKEAHQYEKALRYYDIALDHTWSESVKAERDEVAEKLENHS